MLVPVNLVSMLVLSRISQLPCLITIIRMFFWSCTVGEIVRMFQQPNYYHESLKDRRRRPEGGEWEPIKITHSNLAYIPNLKIRHVLSLGKNGQVLSLGQNGQDLTRGKTGQVLTLEKIGQVSALVKTDKFSALVKTGKTDKQIQTSSQPC
jgi:hypothetical protein